jgi:hypothetical protein
MTRIFFGEIGVTLLFQQQAAGFLKLVLISVSTAERGSDSAIDFSQAGLSPAINNSRNACNFGSDNLRT